MTGIVFNGLMVVVLITLGLFLRRQMKSRSGLLHGGYPWFMGGLLVMGLGALFPLAVALGAPLPDLPWAGWVATPLGMVLIGLGLGRWLPRITPSDQVERFTRELVESYARIASSHQDLESGRDHLHTITQSIQDALVSLDGEGRVVFWNQGAERLFGYREGEILGRSFMRLAPEELRDPLEPGWHDFALLEATEVPAHSVVELHGLSKGGEKIALEATLAAWSQDGERNAVGIFRDISDRKRQEKGAERVQQSRVAISALLRTSLEPISFREQLERALDIILSVPWLTIESKGSIFLMDDEANELVLEVERGLHEHLLKACARLPMGYCLCGKAAQTREIVFSGCMDERHDVTFEGIKEHGHYCVPIMFQDRLLGVVNMYLAHGHQGNFEETEFLSAIANTLAGIIERRRAEEKLKHLAHHDALTGLPNRQLFLDRLGTEVARARRGSLPLGVMFMDLDKFKAVNDTLGHEVGDGLLIEVSRRLQETLRTADTVARLGGDEFTVILTTIAKEKDAEIVARKIIEVLQEPFIIQGAECRIGSSIGISFFPDDGEEPDVLLKHADIAMYQVKKKGRNDFLRYTPGMLGED